MCSKLLNSLLFCLVISLIFNVVYADDDYSSNSIDLSWLGDIFLMIFLIVIIVVIGIAVIAVVVISLICFCGAYAVKRRTGINHGSVVATPGPYVTPGQPAVNSDYVSYGSIHDPQASAPPPLYPV